MITSEEFRKELKIVRAYTSRYKKDYVSTDNGTKVSRAEYLISKKIVDDYWALDKIYRRKSFYPDKFLGITKETLLEDAHCSARLMNGLEEAYDFDLFEFDVKGYLGKGKGYLNKEKVSFLENFHIKHFTKCHNVSNGLVKELENLCSAAGVNLKYQ